MARLLDLNLNPDTHTLRRFGFIALVGFGALALSAHFEWLLFSVGLGGARLPVTLALASVGLSAALLSLAAPRANRALYVGLTLLGYPVGFVMSYVMLGTLFFGIIAPVGVMLRLFGHDPLGRSFPTKSDSYWSKYRAQPDKKRYFRQF